MTDMKTGEVMEYITTGEIARLLNSPRVKPSYYATTGGLYKKRYLIEIAEYEFGDVIETGKNPRGRWHHCLGSGSPWTWEGLEYFIKLRESLGIVTIPEPERMAAKEGRQEYTKD